MTVDVSECDGLRVTKEAQPAIDVADHSKDESLAAKCKPPSVSHFSPTR